MRLIASSTFTSQSDAKGVGEGDDVQAGVAVIDQVTTNAAGNGIFDPVHAPYSEKSSGDAARGEQQQRFREQLANEAGAGRPQGAADGEFLGPPAGTRQHQIGDVGAGDQEHQGDDPETNHDLL